MIDILPVIGTIANVIGGIADISKSMKSTSSTNTNEITMVPAISSVQQQPLQPLMTPIQYSNRNGMAMCQPERQQPYFEINVNVFVNGKRQSEQGKLSPNDIVIDL